MFTAFLIRKREGMPPKVRSDFLGVIGKNRNEKNNRLRFLHVQPNNLFAGYSAALNSHSEPYPFP